jgi:hypothetical protein
MVTPSMLMPTHSLVDAYSKVDHSFPFFLFEFGGENAVVLYGHLYIYRNGKKDHIYRIIHTHSLGQLR